MRGVNRWLHNSQQVVRRAGLSLILLVPESVRAGLRKNATLTSIYEYFDRSKYDQVHDQASWEWHLERANRPQGLPHADYVYYEPAFTAEELTDSQAEMKDINQTITSINKANASIDASSQAKK